MLTLFSTALALDCTGLDLSTCTAVNELADAVNSSGTLLTASASNTRLRPSTVYAELNAMRQAFGAAGCTVDGDFDGWSAGRYVGSSVSGEWADLGSSTGGGLVASAVDHRATGTYDDAGVPVGALGSSYGGYNQARQFAADRGTGWIAGRWVRTNGRRGVWVGLHGSCDVGVDVYAVLDGWYAGILPQSTLQDLTMFVAPGPQTYGGLAAMDALCQSEADAVPLTGTFAAAATDVDGGIAVPSQRFPAGLPLVRPDGTPIASDVDAFFDAGTTNVSNPVQVFADGTMATSFVMPGAGFGRGDCGGGTASFTDGQDSLPTLLASPFATDVTRWNLTALACSSAPTLAVGWYCIQTE